MIHIHMNHFILPLNKTIIIDVEFYVFFSRKKKKTNQAHVFKMFVCFFTSIFLILNIILSRCFDSISFHLSVLKLKRDIQTYM